MGFHFFPLGDNAVLIEAATELNNRSWQAVRRASLLLDSFQPPWLIEYIPAFTTVTVLYDPFFIVETGHEDPYRFVCQQLAQLLNKADDGAEMGGRCIEIPVCYGGEYGPDLDFVASSTGMAPEEVIQIHSGGTYQVYMIGFSPGFPYLGGMSDKIAVPRRKTPRQAIPAGSVGLGGNQTGVYSLETPGGWQIIGRTPTRLFLPDENPPSLLQPGDIIKFTPISSEEFLKWEENER
jgi:inhibitor of KinA